MRTVVLCRFAVVALPLGLSACDPTVRQLGTAKDEAPKRDFEAIATTPVTCNASQTGCAQLRSVTADACHRTAEGAPEPIQRERLDCAVENYDAALVALAQKPDPEVDRSQVELGVLDSLQRRRDLATGTAEADIANAALATHASAVKTGENANPAGFYYAADARLNAVLRGGAQGGCVEIAGAARTLGNARAEGTAFAEPVLRLNRAIVNAMTGRGCPG